MSTSSSNGTATLEQRIERLEAELAALRAQGVSTRTLRLVDEDGAERAMLTADRNGPTFVFHDNAGAVRMKLSLSESGPGMTLADDKGHTRAWLGFTKDALRIGFADENGNSRAFFGVMRSGQPVAKFYDEAGNVVWSAE
ncbi:MAG: hypothetical protein RIB58_07675 [Phycisphaerales bacterium]|jgi:hypothetical protein